VLLLTLNQHNQALAAEDAVVTKAKMNKNAGPSSGLSPVSLVMLVVDRPIR